MAAQALTRSIAGAFILISLGLAHMNGQVDLSTLSWMWFTIFVGANPLQSGFTNWCLMTIMLKKVGAK